MKDRYYMVVIISGPEDDIDDMYNPKCYPETYEEAVSIARPWVEQGCYVVITTGEYGDGRRDKVDSEKNVG